MARMIVPCWEARAGDTLVTSQGPRLILEVHPSRSTQTLIRTETREHFLSPDDDVDLIRP